MDYSSLEGRLEKIFQKMKIKLPHGTISDESLVVLDCFKQKNWRLVLYDEYLFSYMHVDFFVQALRKLNIQKIITFMYTDEKGVMHFKSMNSEYRAVKDIFYNIDPNDEDWSSADIVGSSILITNESIDFLVFIDDLKEKFYFYGNADFLSTIFPASKEAFCDYYEAYYDIYEDEPLHVDYLKWLWKTYIAS